MHLSDYIITFGYIGIFITIFAESGFFLGFFLPGDSLLVTLGVLSATGRFDIWTLIMISIVAAILGDSFGYWMGKTFGKSLFSKTNSRFLRPEYLQKTEEFFQKYGKKTIIISRFVPIVRTFAPIFAGIGKMHYPTFLAYNIVGGILWAGGLLTVSHYVALRIPAVNEYLEYIILGIIAVSVLPPAIEFLKHRRRSKKNRRG